MKSPKNNKNKRKWVTFFSKYGSKKLHSRVDFLPQFRRYDNPYSKNLSCTLCEPNHIKHYRSGLKYLL